MGTKQREERLMTSSPPGNTAVEAAIEAKPSQVKIQAPKYKAVKKKHNTREDNGKVHKGDVVEAITVYNGEAIIGTVVQINDPASNGRETVWVRPKSAEGKEKKDLNWNDKDRLCWGTSSIKVLAEAIS